MAHLITPGDVYSRISKTRVDRCLNDAGLGSSDSDAMNGLLEDVSTWIRGKVGPITELSALDAATAGDLKRIALDLARAYLCERAPEVMRQDAKPIFERCAKDIKAIRIGEASIGTEVPPDPMANHGGEVTSGDINDPDYPEPKAHFALDGTGDF